MVPWKTIATESTSDGVVALKQRGERDFIISIDGRVLMTSAAHRSEDALARLACTPIRERARARVLVSGLGMGFTLRAALDTLAADAEVCVAELHPFVLAWCQGPLAALTGDSVRDPRVRVAIEDVSELVARTARDRSAPRFDAIALDMYEGPQAMVAANHPLYGSAAIVRTRQALAPHGVFAIWCEAESPGYERALTNAGFRFRLERAGTGARVHCVYVAHI
jgi:spermidine synthase